jgi:hypothetical protein
MDYLEYYYENNTDTDEQLILYYYITTKISDDTNIINIYIDETLVDQLYETTSLDVKTYILNSNSNIKISLRENYVTNNYVSFVLKSKIFNSDKYTEMKTLLDQSGDGYIYNEIINYDNSLNTIGMNSHDMQNENQDKYYDSEALKKGIYKILPEYYLQYKTEMRMLDLIKKNLELPENYKDLNSFSIIVNIIEYLKIFTKDSSKLEELNNNIHLLKQVLTELKKLFPCENNQDIFDDCYKNVKKVLNTYDIGKILCLIKKNEGYITNDIKKEIINYFFKIQINIIDSLNEIPLYFIVLTHHINELLNNDMNEFTNIYSSILSEYLQNFVQSETSTSVPLVDVTLTSPQTTTTQSLKDAINILLKKVKIPKKLVAYLIVFVESFIFLVFGKIDNFNSLLGVKDIFLHYLLLLFNMNYIAPDVDYSVLDEITKFIDSFFININSEDINTIISDEDTNTMNNENIKRKNIFYFLFSNINNNKSKINYDELSKRIIKDNNLEIFDDLTDEQVSIITKYLGIFTQILANI